MMYQTDTSVRCNETNGLACCSATSHGPQYQPRGQPLEPRNERPCLLPRNFARSAVPAQGATPGTPKRTTLHVAPQLRTVRSTSPGGNPWNPMLERWKGSELA